MKALTPGGGPLQMKPYTVLILKPDYVTDGCTDTYLAHVEALDPAEAGLHAQHEARAADTLPWEVDDFREEAETAEDYEVLAVFDGHRMNLMT